MDFGGEGEVGAAADESRVTGGWGDRGPGGRIGKNTAEVKREAGDRGKDKKEAGEEQEPRLAPI